MKEFPPVAELSFLVGAELTLIVLGPYQITFHFEDQRFSTDLACESGFEHIGPNGSIVRYLIQEGGCRNLDPLTVHALLYDRVVAIDVLQERLRLALTFRSQHALAVLSVSGPYESGNISRGGNGHNDLWIF